MKQYNLLIVVIVIALIYSCELEETPKEFQPEITPISTLFDEVEFESEEMEQLLSEIKICNPAEKDSIIDGVVPCSPAYFSFYTYNHKRPLQDAFLLQVRKGVNQFPYRRLLIFTREKGNLVMMNGVVGYLVEKRSTENGLDDLIVGVVDNINGKYERYDVLLRYKNGKYHFEEAIGDLEGLFDDDELKTRASKMIHERIKEKQLIF